MPAGRALRARLREYRVDPRPLTARLSDFYGLLYNVVMIGGIAVSAADTGLGAFIRALGSVPTRTADLLRWLVVVTAMLLIALAGKAALTLGPVLVPAAAQTWLLTSPVDRRSLLAARFFVLLGIGAGTGAAFATVLALAARLSDSMIAPVAGMSSGALMLALLVITQADRRLVGITQRLLNALSILCVAFLAMLVVAPAIRWPDIEIALIPLAAVLTVLATLASWRAHIVLGRLDRAALSSGAELATATVTATNWLDPTLLSATVTTRQARAVGAVHSARLHGDRRRILLRAELVRYRRQPQGIQLFVALLPLPYVAAMIVPSNVVAAVHVVCTFLAADRLARGLRIVCRSVALRRALGGSDGELRLVHLILPSAAALLWGVATAPALGHLPVLVTCLCWSPPFPSSARSRSFTGLPPGHRWNISHPWRTLPLARCRSALCGKCSVVLACC